MADHSQQAEIAPREALRDLREGVPLFDLRAAGERAQGTIDGAVPMDIAEPAAALSAQGLAKGDRFLVCCAGGVRSGRVVEQLQQGGFSRACSVQGGFMAWREAGLPVVYAAGLDAQGAERYARHLVLPEIGPAGQQKLGQSRVLVLGAGGLGSPAAMYLAAAGVGHLGIVDDDRVERSNLQRQILHTDAGVGQAKSDSAQQRIQALNPQVEVSQFPVRLDAGSADQLVAGWDLVIDGADNVATKYALNQACVRAGIPLVYGAVAGFEGQVSVFHPHSAPGRNPCYQCLFPDQAAQVAPDCNTAGILGVVPGMVGVLQASEAIKLLVGVGQSLTGRLLLLDLLNLQFHTVHTMARAECPVCPVA